MAGKSKSPLKRAPPGLRSRAPRFTIRLLPVTIFVVSLVLSVRLNDIWRGVTGASTLSVAEAQQPPTPGGRKRGQTAPANAATAPVASTAPAASAPPSTDAAPAATPPNTASGAAPVAAPIAVPASASDSEPPTFTQNEIDVLQKLAERRDALDNRERDLVLRENMIKAAESRIDKKIGEMKSLQASIEAMLKQVDDQDQNKMKSLVKIYENMKPKEAARIFDELDMPVLLSVMSMMKEQKIALIMETMNPARAKALTDAMAQKRTTKAEGQGG